jgi:hypothetical protein
MKACKAKAGRSIRPNISPDPSAESIIDNTGAERDLHLIGLEYLNQNDVLTSISSTVWALFNYTG